MLPLVTPIRVISHGIARIIRDIFGHTRTLLQVYIIYTIFVVI